MSKEGGQCGDSDCGGAYDAYGREKMPSGTLVKMCQEMQCDGTRRHIFDGGPGCSKYLLDGSCNYGLRVDATGRASEAQVLQCSHFLDKARQRALSASRPATSAPESPRGNTYRPRHRRIPLEQMCQGGGDETHRIHGSAFMGC